MLLSSGKSTYKARVKGGHNHGKVAEKASPYIGAAFVIVGLAEEGFIHEFLNSFAQHIYNVVTNDRSPVDYEASAESLAKEMVDNGYAARLVSSIVYDARVCGIPSFAQHTVSIPRFYALGKPMKLALGEVIE